MVRIGRAHARTAILLVVFAAAFLTSCGGKDNQAGPLPPGSEIRVMAVAASYDRDGQPRMDVTVAVSRDGVPVTDAEVTLNGRAIPRATSGAWYRGSTLPFADGRTVANAVIGWARMDCGSALEPSRGWRSRNDATPGLAFRSRRLVPVSSRD